MASSVEKRASRSLTGNFYLSDSQSFTRFSELIPVHNFASSSTLPKFPENLLVI